MKLFIKLILMLLVIAATLMITTYVLIGVVSAKENCTAFEDAAKTLNLTLPIKVNKITTLHHMLVMCKARTVVYTKTIDKEVAELEDSWLGEMRIAWNNTMCGNSPILQMIQKKWEFIDQIYFSGGSVYYIIAVCQKKKVAKRIKKHRHKKKKKYVKKK